MGDQWVWPSFHKLEMRGSRGEETHRGRTAGLGPSRPRSPDFRASALSELPPSHSDSFPAPCTLPCRWQRSPEGSLMLRWEAGGGCSARWWVSAHRSQRGSACRFSREEACPLLLLEDAFLHPQSKRATSYTLSQSLPCPQLIFRARASVWSPILRRCTHRPPPPTHTPPYTCWLCFVCLPSGM